MADETAPPQPFEQGLEELEKIVERLEGGEMPLEQALELFERGVQLSDNCRKQLEEAEHKVEILLRKGRKVEAEPFELDEGERE